MWKKIVQLCYKYKYILFQSLIWPLLALGHFVPEHLNLFMLSCWQNSSKFVKSFSPSSWIYWSTSQAETSGGCRSFSAGKNGLSVSQEMLLGALTVSQHRCTLNQRDSQFKLHSIASSFQDDFTYLHLWIRQNSDKQHMQVKIEERE